MSVVTEKQEQAANQDLISTYTLLNESIRDIIIIVRMSDGKLLGANRAAVLEYGYSNDELLNLQISDLRSPDTQAQIESQMRQANSIGILFESNHRRKDGSVFPVEVSSKGIDFHGELCNFSSIRNITERKEAEQIFRKADQLLERTFASIEDVVLILDAANQTIIQTNSACERVLGYSAQELVGKTAQFLFAFQADYEYIGEIFEESIQQTGTFHRESRLKRKDGVLIIAEISINEILDDSKQRIGLIGVIRDITQSRQDNIRLFRSESRYKAFFENMNEGIALLEYKIKDGRYPRLYFQEANPAFLRLIARTKEQIYEQELQDVFQGSEQVWTDLSQRVVLAGEAITIEQNYPPLEKIFRINVFGTESGKFAILLMDITEKKRAEKELRDFADRLQALSRRLLIVQEEERRHLGRELHDEIGQLLTGLKFGIEANMENGPESGKPASQSALKIVNDLIVQVRELSIRLRPALLDDFGLVAALINLCDRCRKFSDLDVKLEHSGLETRLPIEIETGAYRITQEALTNIIRHAGTKQATVRVWVEGNLLRIDIKDRGKGFDVEAFLASGQTAGLSGIFERASLLNGKTVIESAPGLGTHISTWLPVELRQMDVVK